MSKRLVFCVTNDLVYDQRMNRICSSLANAGYKVTLVGRTHANSPALQEKPFEQKRFRCLLTKGKLFYVEYNIKLFFVLLFIKADLLGAIDLDSILPVLWASKLRGKQRVYDAHELFCEMQEISTRPLIYKIWKGIERYAVPQFPLGYTIGKYYALEFAKMYNVQYAIVRNATIYNSLERVAPSEPTYILYQGAINEGRCFEQLIPAMQHVSLPLVICGAGNFFEETKVLVAKYNLQDKVTMHGYVPPQELKQFTEQAYIGITLFSDGAKSKSNYLSMANRFFDYMHSGVPQICVGFPEYKDVNEEFEIAVLLNEVDENTISTAINALANDKEKHAQLAHNTLACRKQYCWQEEEKKLIAFYKKHIG
jgi:glycosyltransferase involved in cell wall biosynthesis